MGMVILANGDKFMHERKTSNNKQYMVQYLRFDITTSLYLDLPACRILRAAWQSDNTFACYMLQSRILATTLFVAGRNATAH